MEFESAETTDRGIVPAGDGATLEVMFLAPGIARIRGWHGDEPPMSPLLRYGLWRREWPEVDVETDLDAYPVTTSSDLMTVRMHGDRTLVVTDAEGGDLLRSAEPPMFGPDPGFRVRFELPANERFYGLGDQTRDRIEHRGTKGDLWIRNVEEYIPIPFVLSSRGYGLLMNTTRRVWYDLGATSDDWFGFECENEVLDLYVIYGPSPAEIIERYTRVTGRPFLPPKWGFGLWFICRTQADSHEFLSDCRNFRDRKIPCDAIGLEPGWMATNYDATVEKTWDPDRFPMPRYDRNKTNFFSAAQRMGFKPGLWLCNDYDLSYEEERRVDDEVREADAARDEQKMVFAEGHEEDEHLQGQMRLDKITKPEEPWFDHLKTFVYEGAHWFKQDGAYQCLEHPDRLWGNGMTDEQMHNLYPLLYSKQMYLGFAETDERDSGVPERTFPFTPDGWAGLQRWTGTWTGDTGGGEEP
ncbi:MAG: TIM-barrel domain-containing protein, partial [Armatimonadota bacterium]